MRPDCLILDESTAMLDPRGRAQVMKTIRNLRDAGISIVSITHYMEEAAQADRILVMSRGRIVMEGTPEQVFSQTSGCMATTWMYPRPPSCGMNWPPPACLCRKTSLPPKNAPRPFLTC